MGRQCVAYKCNNSDHAGKRKEGVTFHAFPLKRPEILRCWVAKIGRKGFRPTAYSFLCSEHFEEDAFKYQRFTGQRQVKPDAVPSKFVFTPNEPATQSTSYMLGESVQNVEEPVQVQGQSHASVATQTYINMDEMTKLLTSVKDQEETIVKLKQIIEDDTLSFNNIKDGHVKDLTGFSKQYVSMLFDFFKMDDALENKTKPCSLSKINQFFVTLMRLRHGLTFRVLAAIFRIESSSIHSIFNKCIDIMYSKAQSVTIWPSKDQVQAYMPLIFQNHFPTCRVIIDATEFYIHKPGNPTQQQASFSTYKNYNTLKSLIGITPSGAISFISDLWLGSISDKELTIRSGLLDLLEEGDTVLADRGFTALAPEFEKKKVSLFTPTFLKDKIQFAVEERGENKRVSSHRCHVERAIGKIKQFRILDGVIPTSLKNLEEIYYICAFLCNFSEAPLISTLNKV